MRFIVLLLMLNNLVLANDGLEKVNGDPIQKSQDHICEEYYPVTKDNIQDIQKVLDHKMLKLSSPYYFYYEGHELEDVQAFKNCIDYTQCGNYRESIVDDPANYRIHIWKSMSPDELTTLIRSCPVKDLAKNLVVRYGSQTGKNVNIKNIKPFPMQYMSVAKKASPAIFHEPSQAVSKSTVDIVKNLLKSNKVKEAQRIILYTWGIDLHGYDLSYSGKKGNFAVTNHDKKTISYGSDWLTEPCDYIRMIRHEAEHVAQMKMANSCPTHNFDDHKNRERAAHLNDARFMDNICVNTKDGNDVRKFCLDRFRSNYMNK